MAHVDVTPVYENTTMKAYYNSSNVLRAYYIAPIEGYVLHYKELDQPELDENLNETGNILKGYIPYPSSMTVGYNYDFEANPREIYAVPADTVPENQIFNNGGNGHEVM